MSLQKGTGDGSLAKEIYDAVGVDSLIQNLPGLTQTEKNTKKAEALVTIGIYTNVLIDHYRNNQDVYQESIVTVNWTGETSNTYNLGRSYRSGTVRGYKDSLRLPSGDYSISEDGGSSVTVTNSKSSVGTEEVPVPITITFEFVPSDM